MPLFYIRAHNCARVWGPCHRNITQKHGVGLQALNTGRAIACGNTGRANASPPAKVSAFVRPVFLRCVWYNSRMPASDQGVSVSRHRYQIIPRVLCFVRHGADLLLIRGAPTKRIWANKYNGLGGHIEPDESPAAAARREIREESGLEVRDLRLRGVVTIQAGDPVGIGLYVYTAWADTRAVVASTEGRLEWVPADAVTTCDLVEDLVTVIPHLLALDAAAPPFSAHYSYDAAGRLDIRFDA